MTSKNLHRKKLPETRQAIVHEFIIDGIKAYITVGLYEDGSPGEIFIDAAKEGSTISGLLDTVAISISMGLQHGISLDKFVKKFSYMSFPPQGFVKDYGYCNSIIDYIFKWLGKTFDLSAPKKEKHINEEIPKETTTISSAASLQDATTSFITIDPNEQFSLTKEDPYGSMDAPPCKNCGSLTQRAGSCYCCPVCGETSGCS